MSSATGARVSLLTNEDGNFTAPVLQVGAYRITASAQGFKSRTLENFTVRLSTLLKARPAAAKVRYLKGITLSSTMGPGFTVDTQRAQAMS